MYGAELVKRQGIHATDFCQMTDWGTGLSPRISIHLLLTTLNGGAIQSTALTPVTLTTIASDARRNHPPSLPLPPSLAHTTRLPNMSRTGQLDDSEIQSEMNKMVRRLGPYRRCVC